MPAPQNFANHIKIVPLYHQVLAGLILLTLIGAGVNLGKSWGDHERIYSASLILVQTIALMLLWVFCRVFPLKAQDRAIRAEENLRHFALTGKLLDSRLTVKQVVALRFAPDSEFVALAREAADKSLPPKSIKQAIKNWKPDYDRL